MRNPTSLHLTRRSFLARTAAASALLAPRGWWKAVAGPFEGPDFDQLVPRDKRLQPAWLRSLTERGEATVYQGSDLANIGMPVGGIGCGQLYLGGDGRLWLWDIFNQPPPPDFGDYRGPLYATPLKPASPIEQGFALQISTKDGTQIRRLDASGFADVRFRGEYPVGRVEYRDPESAVEVSLEAFSPFVPLAVEDSSLPLTVMEFTVRNPGRTTMQVALAGWLENAACLGSGRPGRGYLVNSLGRDREATVLELTAVPERLARPVSAPEESDILFDDFERDTHEGWTATGSAFGSGPVRADAMPPYQGRVDAHGERLINSHASAPGADVTARDAATGTLTSSPFVIARSYINFLIGGGAHRGRTCLNLLIDGRVVLSATGENDNRLKAHSWDVEAWRGKTAQLALVDSAEGGWGNVGLDEIVFSDTPRVPPIPLIQEEDYGGLALAMLAPAADDFGQKRLASGPLALESVFLSDRGELKGDRSWSGVSTPFGERPVGALGRRMRLRPGRSATVTFLVAWFFPAIRRAALSHVTGIADLRRAYANRFSSAADVVRYAAANFPRLAGETRRWRQTWYDQSTLPHWFLERTFVNVSTLATATCHQFNNGRFYGWEGTYCCAGTCQHVWQYAQGVGRVFPALERSVREMVDYGLAFHADTGALDYRAEAHRVVAIDGQAGTILRVYREHQMSADDAFLRRIWPRVRKSVEHLLARDPDGNGLLQGEQYNTLDASWYGQIPWLSSLYCAAVRAAAAMAREMGDTAFAEHCDSVAASGGNVLVERLFNGEYFIQKPDALHPEAINTNDGCHIDQVFGQSWAFQVGLPRVLPAVETRKSLEALWRYNFTPDVGIYRDRFKVLPGGRWYAMPGEGGLLMCTWPKGGAEKAAGKGDATFVGYFNECMTGFEYQVAAHMIWEELTEQGLAVTRMIHDRYHASKRNPFNEVECSSHYARAMASHGVYLAVCGFEYHGPRGELAFAPRIVPGDFRAAFIGAEGWGTYSQRAEGQRQSLTIEVVWGRLRLNRLTVALLPGVEGRGVEAEVNRRRVGVSSAREQGRLAITWETPLELKADRLLKITVV